MFPTPGTGVGAGYGGNAPGGAAAGGGQRELRYKITVTADAAQANQQLVQLGQSAQHAATAAQRAGQAVQQTQAGASPYGQVWAPQYTHQNPYLPQQYKPPAAPAAAPRAGFDPLGGIMGMQQNLLAFGAALASVTAVVQSAARALQYLDVAASSHSTARERFVGGVSALPVVGGVFGGVTDLSLGLFERFGSDGVYNRRAYSSGRTQQVQERLGGSWMGRNLPAWATAGTGELVAAQLEYAADQDYMRDAPYRTALDRSTFAYDMDKKDRARAMADTMGEARIGRFGRVMDIGLMHAPDHDPAGRYAGGRGRFDREDAFDAGIRGAVRARERQRYAVDAASGLSLSAMGAVKAGEGMTRWSEPGYRKAVGEAADLYTRSLTDPRVGESVGVAAQRAQEALAAHKERLLQYQQALNQAQERSVALAQQEYELGQRRVGVLQSELQVVEAKRERLKGYAVGYAGMDPVSRGDLMLGVQKAKANGFDSLPPEMKQMLLGNGITGQFATDLAAKSVSGDEGFAALLKAVGLQDQSTLDAERLKLRGQIEVDLQLNEDEYLKRLEAAFSKFAPRLNEVMGKLLDVKLNEAKLQMFQGSAQKR